MNGTVLRVAGIRSEGDLELVRDALDEAGVDYEHVDSEPEESYPQTAYFQVSSGLSAAVDNLLLQLSEVHGFDAELL